MLLQYVLFVFLYVGRQVISLFKSLRTGSQVFVLLMLFLCVILHNMWLLLLLFSTTMSDAKSVKVPVVEVAERTN